MGWLFCAFQWTVWVWVFCGDSVDWWLWVFQLSGWHTCIYFWITGLLITYTWHLNQQFSSHFDTPFTQQNAPQREPTLCHPVHGVNTLHCKVR